jgi:hypothetical protein
LTCFNLIDYLMECSSVTWCSTFTATNFAHINSSWLLGVKFFLTSSRVHQQKIIWQLNRNWRQRNHAGHTPRMTSLPLHGPLNCHYDGKILRWTINHCWQIQTGRPWTDSFESIFLCQEKLYSILLQS